jgi:hypothetical protein
LALSVFIFLHVIFLSADGVLQEGERNVIWYGFLATLDIAMGIALLIFKFKPLSSAIAWLCLFSSLVNMGYGIFYVLSYMTPVWLDVLTIEMYTRTTLAITGVQVLGFIIAGGEIARYNRNSSHSIFSLFIDENHKVHARDMG